MIHGEYLRFRKTVAATVEILILVYIDDENVEIALPVISVQQMRLTGYHPMAKHMFFLQPT